MKMTRYLERNNDITNNINSLRKSYGLIDYKREIILYFHKTNNIKGVDIDHEIINGWCTITNYSIVYDKEKKYIKHEKTIYLCDLVFNSNENINSESFNKETLNNYLNLFTVKPIKAFSSIYLEENEKINNVGLVYVSFNLINPNNIDYLCRYDMSEDKLMNKEFVSSDIYNPKYYTNIENKIMQDDTKSGNLIDFIDNKTIINYCILNKIKNIEFYVNNVIQNERIINKSIMKFYEIINNIFSILFINNIEEFLLIYSSEEVNPLNIKVMKSFINYKNKEDKIELLNKISNELMRILKLYKNGEPVHIIIGFNKFMIYSTIMYINSFKEYKIHIPITTAYENISNMREEEYYNKDTKQLLLESEIIKSDMIEQLENTGNIINKVNNIINYITDKTKCEIMNIEDKTKFLE